MHRPSHASIFPHASSTTCIVHIHLSAPTTHAHHSHLHSYPLRSLNTPVQLVRAGHEVRLYIAPEYQPLVPTLAGLSVTCSQQTVAAGMQKLEPYIADGNQAAMFKAVVETSIEFYAQEADAIKAVCEGWAEVVIFNEIAAPEACAVTEVLNIKLMGANVQPSLPTRELFPFSGSVKLPKFMNLFIWWLFLEKVLVSASLKREVEKWKAANGARMAKLGQLLLTSHYLQLTTLWLFATLTCAPRGCVYRVQAALAHGLGHEVPPQCSTDLWLFAHVLPTGHPACRLEALRLRHHRRLGVERRRLA